MLRCTYFLLSLLCTLQRLNDAREIMSLVLVVNTLLSISFFLSLFSFFYFKSALFETKKEKKKWQFFNISLRETLTARLMNNAGLNSDISILSMIWQTDKEKKLAVFKRNWRRKMKDIYIYASRWKKIRFAYKTPFTLNFFSATIYGSGNLYQPLQDNGAFVLVSFNHVFILFSFLRSSLFPYALHHEDTIIPSKTISLSLSPRSPSFPRSFIIF